MKRLSTRAWREGLTDLYLAGPTTLVLAVLIFLPVLAVFALSFTDYQLGDRHVTWVGLDQYITLFTDPIGRRAITNTLIYVGVMVPASIVLALLVALGLHEMAMWSPTLSRILRAAYFLPVAATLVAMALAWQMLLHPSIGLVNMTLVGLGLPAPAWFSDRGLVIYTLALIGIWQTVGYNMVLFLAGLAVIPRHLYDAAEVDGVASGWSRFWTVTWPMLGPTTLFVAVITATTGFRVFETVAALTRGGPAFASDTLVYALYREGFVYFKVGYASAITVVFFFCVALLTFAQYGLLQKRVHYR